MFACKKEVVREIEQISVDWMRLAQDSDRWLALGNAIMNPRVS
jgi:hypothetical protein